MNEIRKRKSGQAMLEFALVLPLLALVLFGIIQYGFIFAAYMTLRNAATVGARHAILGTNPTVAQIQSATQGAVTPMLVSNNVVVTVTSNVTVGTVSGATTVQARYNLPLIVPFVVIGNSGSILALSTSATMR